jgi:hypothetical protein
VTHFDTRSRTGTIVGVIGGYQQGGDTPAVSYSAYLSTGLSGRMNGGPWRRSRRCLAVGP